MSYHALLREFNLRPKHSLGQVFLIDENVIERILAILDLREEDCVVELGAGPGFITAKLGELAGNVVAIEIDRKFQALHEYLFASLDNRPRVLYEDALKVDFSSFLPEAPKRLMVFGNLPYYLTTDLMLLAISEMATMERALFMVEADVAERLMATPGTKKYGTISIVTGLFGSWRFERTVSRHSFTPKPNVTSALVTLIPSKEIDDKRVAADPSFHRFLIKFFQYRRKTLSNAFKLAFTSEDARDRWQRIAGICQISDDVRAEQLSPQQFKKLFESFSNLSQS